MVYIIILLLLEINFLTESYFQESNGSDKRNVKLCFNVVDAIPMIHLIYWPGIGAAQSSSPCWSSVWIKINDRVVTPHIPLTDQEEFVTNSQIKLFIILQLSLLDSF